MVNGFFKQGYSCFGTCTKTFPGVIFSKKKRHLFKECRFDV